MFGILPRGWVGLNEKCGSRAKAQRRKVEEDIGIPGECYDSKPNLTFAPLRLGARSMYSLKRITKVFAEGYFS
jgi:hypothetical protein